MIQPYYRSENVTLYCADCLEVLPQLEGVDAIVTDPPYGVGIDYNGFKETYEWWLQLMTLAIPACLQVTDGPTLMFGAAPVRFYSPFVNAHASRMLIWSPKFTLSKTSANGMMFRWHPIWCWRLPTKQDAFAWDILDDMTECGNDWYHPGTKPCSLMCKLTCLVPASATVLDPFMGSGTTGVACIRTGRKFIGIEIDEGYCKIAEKRIREAEAKLKLPFDTLEECYR